MWAAFDTIPESEMKGRTAMKLRVGFVLVLFATLLTACGGKAESGAVSAVERYYLAIIQQSQEDLAKDVCASFEAEAKTELDSFKGVKTELSDFACSESDKTDQDATVKCTGKIVATYGNEKMDFPIEGRAHKVVNQSGDWLVCGY
jgi:hypothetical protein